MPSPSCHCSLLVHWLSMNNSNRTCGTQYWGTSNWSAQQLTEANEIAQKLDMVGPIAEQPPYSMLNRDFVESEFMPIYDKYGLGIMCYSPLAGGVLTGKYSSQATEKADATSRFVQRGGPPADQVEKADALAPICAELDCEMAHLALAWALANPNISTLIAGATKISQLESNLKCFDVLPKLTPDVMAKIDEAVGTKPEGAAETNSLRSML